MTLFLDQNAIDAVQTFNSMIQNLAQEWRGVLNQVEKRAVRVQDPYEFASPIDHVQHAFMSSLVIHDIVVDSDKQTRAKLSDKALRKRNPADSIYLSYLCATMLLTNGIVESYNALCTQSQDTTAYQRLDFYVQSLHDILVLVHHDINPSPRAMNWSLANTTIH